jgi:hypothetical protein
MRLLRCAVAGGVLAASSLVGCGASPQAVCEVSVTVVSLAAEALHNEDLADFLRFVEPGKEKICEQVARTWFTNPSTSQKLRINTPGGSLTRTYTGLDLGQPPSTPPTWSPDHTFACFKAYAQSAALAQLCYDGVLAP